MTTTVSPGLGHAPSFTQQGTGASPGYDAIDRRRAIAGFERGEGAATFGSFRVVQRGAGANMSVDIGQDDGAWVRGDAVALQALYYVAPHNATINETITTADATNPRLDQVILEIQDNVHDGSTANIARTRVVAGTPTSGATIDNRTGAAALPGSALLLADVLVPAGAASITNATIRDRRQLQAGSVPPLLTLIDQVAFVPVMQALVWGSFAGATQWSVPMAGAADLAQTAAAMTLPRRIVGATRIRWKYLQQNTTALTGNYVIGIYDASGRKIVDTGSVAFAGAANGLQSRSETISATTFEPGVYYVLIGLDSTNSGVITYHGVRVSATQNDSPGPIGPNMGLFSPTGGVTAPATILGFTDQYGVTVTGANATTVPVVSLSVG